MLRPRYSVNDMFIGVAEEEIKFKKGTQIMKAKIDVAKFTQESLQALKGEHPTEIYKKLIKGIDGYTVFGIMVELIFTNQQSWEKFGQKYSIEIVKVLNLSKDRSERTILEVKIEGIERSMVLKCVECEANNISTGRVITLAQKEIIAYDNLPTNLRDVFVEKYAHGRMWFDNSSYEVILMEKMEGPDLYNGLMQIKHKIDNIEQYVWLAKAVGLLHRIHMAGFFHGDAHTGNLMWSNGNGKGELKFLDPERMVNMNTDGCDNVTKAIRKMSDLSNIFFFNPMSVYNIFPNRDIFHIDFRTLHMRLTQIRTILTERNQKNYFPLDELFPFDVTFAYAGASDINTVKKKLMSINQIQYRKLNEEKFNTMFDDFTSALTDPSYAKQVFIYIIKEINKSKTTARIDGVDLDIPRQEVMSTLPLPIPQPSKPGQPIPSPGAVALYTPSPSPSRLHPRAIAPNPMNVYGSRGSIPQQSGIYPLKYKGQTIEGRDTNSVFYDIYYSFNDGVGISLMRYNYENREFENLRSFIREMYVSGKHFESSFNGQARQVLFFAIDRTRKELVVYQSINTDKGLRYTPVDRVKLVETLPQPAQTLSNARKSVSNPREPIHVNRGNGIQLPMAMQQLIYNGRTIQAHDDASGVLYDILYSRDKGGNITLFKFNRITNEHHTMARAVIRGMYTEGQPVKSSTGNTNLFFSIDSFSKQLIIQKLDATTGRYQNIETVSL